MKKFYIKNNNEEPEMVEAESDKIALVKWCEKHNYDVADTFYGNKDGQISILDEKEHKEYLKDHIKIEHTLILRLKGSKVDVGNLVVKINDYITDKFPKVEFSSTLE